MLDESICTVGLGDNIISNKVGETYIMLEDEFDRKSFAHVIVTADKPTKAYNVEKEVEKKEETLWNFDALGVTKMHEHGITGKGVKIGIINCGVKDFMDVNI